jgi:DNA-binding NarL/FixJ family response regulator
MAQVVLVSKDLGLASRLQGAAAALGLSLAIAPEVKHLPGCLDLACRLVLLDLAEEGVRPAEVVPLVRADAPAARIVAFGPHVQQAVLAAAEAAGCDQVLSRGQFHGQYATLLQQCRDT